MSVGHPQSDIAQRSYNTMETRQLSQINFGWTSTESIRQQAVVRLCSAERPKFYGSARDTQAADIAATQVAASATFEGVLKTTDIHSAHMSPCSNEERCLTCDCTQYDCPGHFGMIQLSQPVFNPLCIKFVLVLLRCVCFKCSRLLLTPTCRHEPHCQCFWCRLMWTDSTSPSIRHYVALSKRSKGVICVHCHIPQPMFSLEKRTLQQCAFEVLMVADPAGDHRQRLRAEVAFAVLHRIPADHLAALRLQAPANMILHVLPLPPPCLRPPIIREQEILVDKISKKYQAIVTVDRQYCDAMNRADMQRAEECSLLLAMHVRELFWGNPNKQKNGDSLVSLRDRISGKYGMIRFFLSGKRVDFSGRSVVSPDPYVDFDEVRLPLAMAQRLSTPHYVTERNKNALNDLLLLGRVNAITRGQAYFTVVRNDGLFTSETHDPVQLLKIGDIAHVQLDEGALIVVNRAPTLGIGSMMMMRARIFDNHSVKTIGINPAVTGSFNMDFDGDEATIHIPQDLPSRVEADLLMRPSECLMNEQNSAPRNGLIQDAIVGLYFLSLPNTRIAVEPDLFDLMLEIDCDLPDLYNKTKQRLSDCGYPSVRPTDFVRERALPARTGAFISGRMVLSLLFPSWISYRRRNDILAEEPYFVIEHGIVVAGAFDKHVLGTTGNNVLQLCRQYGGASLANDILSRAQRLANRYLSQRGFSVGISDCLLNMDKRAHDKLCALHPRIAVENDVQEMSILQHLQSVMNESHAIVRESLSSDNALAIMVSVGSKGNRLNVCQIGAMIGQQMSGRGRIGMRDATSRPLPHFPAQTRDPHAYGFISRSYLSGLPPAAFWFHAQSAREALIARSVSTQDTGYFERQLVKVFEPIQIAYDRTVRSFDRIVQFQYGNDGLAPEACIRIDSHPQFVHLQSWTERIELSYAKSNENQNSHPPRLLSDEEKTTILARLAQAVQRHAQFNGDAMAEHTTSLLQRQLETLRIRYPVDIEALLHHYFRALVAPGAAVGVIMATSICGLFTQAMLDAVHSTGASRSSAINRISALQHARFDPSASSCFVYFRKENVVASELIQVLLGDLLRSKHMRKRPAKPPWWYFFEIGPVFDLHAEYFIELQLDAEKLARGMLHVDVVATRLQMALQKHTKLRHMFTVLAGPSMGEPLIHLWLHDDVVVPATQNPANACPIFLFHRAMPLLDDLLLFGIANITDVRIREEDGSVQTTGSNLRAILNRDDVDRCRTYSDSAVEMQTIFGIEAARTVHIRAFHSVICGGGKYVDPRHIELLVDGCTSTGTIGSISRHGIPDSCNHVINRCTFEEPLRHFVTAASLHRYDDLHGVSASIVTGRLARVGTGAMDLLLDDSNFC